MRKNLCDSQLNDVANLFKVFGDSTRIKILNCLVDNERSVTDIVIELNMNQSAISHQLQTLKNSKLVKNRKDGKIVYYSLDCEHVRNIINQGLEHINE